MILEIYTHQTTLQITYFETWALICSFEFTYSQTLKYFEEETDATIVLQYLNNKLSYATSESDYTSRVFDRIKRVLLPDQT